MRKITIILVVLLMFLPVKAAASTFESLDLINSFNFAQYFADYLGFKYDSHGCLHFTPSDIYLLYRTIPKGVPLQIKAYREKNTSFSLGEVPFLDKITNSEKDIKAHAKVFRENNTGIIIYPGLGRAIITVNGRPYAQVETLAGPPYEFKMVTMLIKDQPVEWDAITVGSTDPGTYKILGRTARYRSNAYSQNTIVPFGAWMVKKDGRWSFQEGAKWYFLPRRIIDDLEKGYGNGIFDYYDLHVNERGDISSARWAGNDFGKYVLMWTRDGRNMYPEIGYCSGELLYEQVMLVKDLAQILTVPGPDDIETCLAQNINFSLYKKQNAFILSNGTKEIESVDQPFRSYFKLYNGLELTDDDRKNIDPRMMKAFEKCGDRVKSGDIRGLSREELGLYNYLKLHDIVLRKQARWYRKLNDDWSFWGDLRKKLREDLKKNNIPSYDKQQMLVREWLGQRLEFKTAGF